MSKTAIIVDSACSLPQHICDKYGVSYAPLSYTVNGETKTDPCDPEHAVKLFRSGVFGKKNDVYTTPPSPQDFEKAIMIRIEAGYTRVLVQTLNRTQGDTYNNANTAVARVSKILKDQNVTVRVLDSRTVFAGQGLMAIETIRRLVKEKNEDDVRRKMNVISEKIHTFILPKEIMTARARSAHRNEKSVGKGQAVIADTLGIYPILCNVNDTSSSIATVWGFEKAAQAMFDHACSRIEAGLFSPIITVTHAGPLEDLKAMPGYAHLENVAKSKKLMLVPAVSSLAAGIYTSPGSVSLALATAPHEWEK